MTWRLSDKERFRVVMERTDADQFLDREEESQCILNMDLFPEWVRRQQGKRDLSTHEYYVLIDFFLLLQVLSGLLEKADTSPSDAREAENASNLAIRNILTLIKETWNSINRKHLSQIRGLRAIFMNKDTNSVFTADPKIYYLRYFASPIQKYSDFHQRYDSNSNFWREFQRKTSKLPTPTMDNSFPITRSFHALDPVLAKGLANIEAEPTLQQYVKKWIKKIAAGYPPTSNLQAKLLSHVKRIYFVVDQLPIAIIREDLSQFIFTLCTLQSTVNELQELGGLNYRLREECYQNKYD